MSKFTSFHRSEQFIIVTFYTYFYHMIQTLALNQIYEQNNTVILPYTNIMSQM